MFIDDAVQGTVQCRSRQPDATGMCRIVIICRRIILVARGAVAHGERDGVLVGQQVRICDRQRERVDAHLIDRYLCLGWVVRIIHRARAIAPTDYSRRHRRRPLVRQSVKAIRVVGRGPGHRFRDRRTAQNHHAIRARVSFRSDRANRERGRRSRPRATAQRSSLRRPRTTIGHGNPDRAGVIRAVDHDLLRTDIKRTAGNTHRGWTAIYRYLVELHRDDARFANVETRIRKPNICDGRWNLGLNVEAPRRPRLRVVVRIPVGWIADSSQQLLGCPLGDAVVVAVVAFRATNKDGCRTVDESCRKGGGIGTGGITPPTAVGVYRIDEHRTVGITLEHQDLIARCRQQEAPGEALIVDAPLPTVERTAATDHVARAEIRIGYESNAPLVCPESPTGIPAAIRETNQLAGCNRGQHHEGQCVEVIRSIADNGNVAGQQVCMGYADRHQHRQQCDANPCPREQLIPGGSCHLRVPLQLLR